MRTTHWLISQLGKVGLWGEGKGNRFERAKRPRRDRSDSELPLPRINEQPSLELSAVITLMSWSTTRPDLRPYSSAIPESLVLIFFASSSKIAILDDASAILCAKLCAIFSTLVT